MQITFVECRCAEVGVSVHGPAYDERNDDLLRLQLKVVEPEIEVITCACNLDTECHSVFGYTVV